MAENRLKSSQWVDSKTHVSLCRKFVEKPIKLHLHEYYELELVISGTGEQNMNGTVYQLTPGTVSFLTPIDFHSLTPNGSMFIATLAFEEVLLSPRMQQMFMKRRGNYIFQANSQVNETMQTLMELLFQEIQADDSYSVQVRQSLLELLLITVARSTRDQGREAESGSQMQSSLEYLFCHFREEITLEQVAKQSGYTPNYFSKLFHEFCGERFVDFLTQLRVNYAKMLLLSTDLSVAAIAETSGFGSASNFFRRFRQTCGVSPAQYREQKQTEAQ